MALTCGFFNSENGDRKYNAEQMSAIFDGIIADGVFTTIGDHMAVSAGTGMQVLVGTGKAWFDHTWNVNDAAYPLAIAASDVTLSRIDAIVLETNHSDSVRLNKLRVVQGTVASSPVKPSLTNSEKVHQHPLAWVTVAPGVTQIAASAIENAVGTSACPFVTGIIATTAIDDLFNQWNGEFDEWLDNLKAQLSDNVVTNLQRQIDDLNTKKVNVSDKATAQDVTDGTNDTKWVTPKGLSDHTYKIGDILSTVRKDLDDKWLLCNGSTVDANLYPDLSDILIMTPENANAYTSTLSKQLSDISTTPAINYLNGYQVCTYRNHLLYSQNNFKNYIQRDNLYTMDYPYEHIPEKHCSAYGNGRYVFGLWDNISKTISIIYGTSLGGSFTKKQFDRLTGRFDSCDLKGVTFINDYFYVVYSIITNISNCKVHVQKSRDCINWTDMIIASGTDLSRASIPYYVNGLYYMMVGTGTNEAKIYSGPSIENMSIANGTPITDLDSANGYLFATKTDGLYYFKKPSENWTRCNLERGGYPISYGNGIYASRDSFVYGLNGAKQSVPGGAQEKRLLLYNGIGLRMLYTQSDSGNSGHIEFSVIQPTLPEISSSGFYHYIKAK